MRFGLHRAHSGGKRIVSHRSRRFRRRSANARSTIDAAGEGRRGSFQDALLATVAVAFGAAGAALMLFLVVLLFDRGLHAQSVAIGWRLQHLLYALVIASANNVDNLGARIAYSVQGTRVDTPVNLWISAITFVISAFAAFSGAAAIGAFGTKVASLIAASMLIGLGSWMIVQARWKSWHEKIHEEKTATRHLTILRKPHHADIDDSKHIDFKEGTILGVALSLNNVGGGMSAGVLGINPLVVGVLSAVISFVALFAGNYVAEYFVKRHIADKAAIAGGMILVLIGIETFLN